jgi:hypothetical protein
MATLLCKGKRYTLPLLNFCTGKMRAGVPNNRKIPYLAILCVEPYK